MGRDQNYENLHGLDVTNQVLSLVMTRETQAQI